ncbi:MAG: dTDP-4-dehydrorhamnose reductase [Elusimicrobia bacterium]|nr:dTDP-4-dehydrorhamnose reductase [Elusimicrobiota bacterium]
MITGIRSRVGIRLEETILQRGDCAVGFTRSGTPTPTVLTMDITDQTQVLRAIQQEKPDIIIHAAAFTDVDGCEREEKEAWNVNVAGSENVALAAKATGSRLLYLSTDYVFDGERGPYSETERPHPIGIYGKTKWEGEKKVQEICPNALVVRTCVPYEWNEKASPNFLMWLVYQLDSKKKVRIVQDQWSTPTYVPYLAESLIHLSSLDCSGVIHLSGKDWLSRYDFALKICRRFHLDERLVEPILTQELKQLAPRPLKGGLLCDKAEKLLGCSMLSIDEGLSRIRV